MSDSESQGSGTNGGAREAAPGTLNLQAQRMRTRWLAAAFIAVILVLPVIAWTQIRLSGADLAHHRAEEIMASVKRVRMYYRMNVVRPILMAGEPIPLSDVRGTPGAVPISALVTQDIGAILTHTESDALLAQLAGPMTGIGMASHSGHSSIDDVYDDEYGYAFVSDWPFASDAGRELTPFQQEALDAFRADPDLDHYTMNANVWFGTQTHRHATPVVMEPMCVACHNSHPNSTKTDWKVGDVRGVEVVEVSGYGTPSGQNGGLLIPYAALLVFVSAFAIGSFGRANTHLRDLAGDLDLARADASEKAEKLAVQAEQLEQQVDQLEILAAVAESATFGITIADATDPMAPIVYANEAFYDMLGNTPAEVMGITCRVLRGGVLDQADLDEMQQAVMAGKRHTIEIYDRKPNGERFWNRMTMFPVLSANGDHRFYVSFQMDITEERQAKEERERMLLEIQEAQRFESLGVLVAGVAHEINNPLGVALTAVSHQDQTFRDLQSALARPDCEPEEIDELIEDQVEGMRLLRDNLQRAATLVRDFKDVAADRSDDDVREVDLAEYLASAASSMQPLMRRTGCDLSVRAPDGVRVTIPTGSMGQLLTNLIVNATVHAFEGVAEKRIEVTAEALDDEIVIRVADSGTGLSPEALSKLYTPFFTTRRGEGGTGLGLYIARRIASSVLGGVLEASNRPEGGAVFTLTFPRQRSDA